MGTLQSISKLNKIKNEGMEEVKNFSNLYTVA